MSRLTKAFCLMSLCLLAPTLTVASGVHPLFDVQSTTGSPFPTDRFTLTDSAQNTDQRASLDANRVYMFGQSLGGVIGTVFMGIEPDIKAGVPTVPGGTFVDVALLSESNRLLLTAFLGSRLPSLLNGGVGGFTDNTPLRNQPPVINVVPGAMEIQRIADVFNWIAQAGESTAWAPFIRKSPLPPIAGPLPEDLAFIP